METQTSSTDGYVLRIGNEDLETQVFNIGKYYSGAIRDFKRGTPILFARKVGPLGDSIIGYGVVDKVENLWEMTPEEEDYCRAHGWKLALTLGGTTHLNHVLPLSQSALKEDRRRGAFLHGAKLSETLIDTLLMEAESRQVQ